MQEGFPELSFESQIGISQKKTVGTSVEPKEPASLQSGCNEGEQGRARRFRGFKARQEPCLGTLSFCPVGSSVPLKSQAGEQCDQEDDSGGKVDTGLQKLRTGGRRRTKKEVHAVSQVRYSNAEKKADLRKSELEWMSAVISWALKMSRGERTCLGF